MTADRYLRRDILRYAKAEVAIVNLQLFRRSRQSAMVKYVRRIKCFVLIVDNLENALSCAGLALVTLDDLGRRQCRQQCLIIHDKNCNSD